MTLLDSAAADRPAAGVRFQLYWTEERGDVLLRAGSTNATGSTDTPLLDAAKLSAGIYKLFLHVGDYFESNHIPNAKQFLDLIPVNFVIEDAARETHIVIRVKPKSYSVECE